jgi:cytochrome c oxidase assembly protein subunit 15
MHRALKRPLVFWLYGNACLILGMIVLGGITRLEGAGLSIVQWKPLTGILPPLSNQDWEALFTLYKTSPEFQKVNFMITLQDFKPIFWLEYCHRLLGRLVGLTFLIPGCYFWMKGWFPPSLKKNFIGMGIVGGAQGLMGWYMVKSGLVDQPHVSHYRLAAHLLLAFFLYGWMLWTAFSVQNLKQHNYPNMRRTFQLLLLPLTLTILYGAFVAGLKAGLIYNTFPLMDGALLPNDAYALNPFYRNFFENPAMVQFIHRWLACGTGGLMWGVTFYFLSKAKEKPLRSALRILQGAVLLQIILGILTLLGNVPTFVATLHQIGAAGVLTIFVYILQRLNPRQHITL